MKKPLKKIHKRVTITCKEPSLTDPSQATECDINRIVDRSLRHNIPLGDPARKALARYGDISQLPDFAEMSLRISAAQQAFMALPSKLRAAYDNDPQEFIKDAQTSEGQELLVRHGLATKRAPEGAPNDSKGNSSSSSRNAVSRSSKTSSKPEKGSQKQDEGTQETE